MAQAPPTFTPDSEFADLETPRGPRGGSLSITALARFEFEAGNGNEGTKILMVEWEDDDLTRFTTEGSWHVSWTGKTTVLPADERPSDSTRRFYFLLPPNTTIPPVVTLSYEPQAKTDNTANCSSPSHVTLQLNPLPAIFPPELGVTGRSAGKKGVLHTIWAKKRLRVLDQEIHEECLNNAEGVALHMAVQEKEWIEKNFGVTAHGVESVASSHDSSNTHSVYPEGPATPVSPISGGKLADKLKGLKLQTGKKDLIVKDGKTSLRTNRNPITDIPQTQGRTGHIFSHLNPLMLRSHLSAPSVMLRTNNLAPFLPRSLTRFRPQAQALILPAQTHFERWHYTHPNQSKVPSKPVGLAASPS